MRRRSPTSRRSTTPSPTAAAPGGSRKRWHEIYVNRICRRYPNGDIEFYTSRKLGAVRQRSRGDLLVFRQTL